MPDEFDVGAPTIRVNVYESGQLIAQVACESADDAADAVNTWEAREGVECVVEDLSVTHGPDDVLTPEPEDAAQDDDRPRDTSD